MLQIENAITELKKNLREMTEIVLEMVSTVQDALKTNDASHFETIYKQDRLLDKLEKDTDHKAIELLALINPRASDLRFVFTVIKLDVDLERIGDECKNIVDELKKNSTNFPEEINQLADKVTKAIKDTFDSLLNRDEKLARSIILRDKEINKLQHKIFKKYPDQMPIAFTTKSLERIGDHATNIAENVIYSATGMDLRHDKTLD